MTTRSGRGPWSIVWRLALAMLLLAGLLLATIDWIAVVTYIPFAVVGGLLVHRRPRNAIGWLLIALGFTFLGTTSPVDLDLDRLEAGSGSLRDLLYVWVGLWAGGASFLLYAALAMVYPSGSLPAGRGRWLAVAALTMGAVAVALPALARSMYTQSFDTGFPRDVVVPNPVGILPDPSPGALPLLQVVVTGIPLVILAASVVALLRRYRHARDIEALQIRWLLASVAFVVTSVIFGLIGFTAWGMTSGIFWIPAVLSYPTVAIAIGFAITRYRLFDIDRIISRTIAWAAVTGLLVGVFVLGVIGLQALLVDVTQGQTVAVAISTLVAFALFQPIRGRVQTAVDRRFDRARYDARRMSDEFATELREEVDLGRLEALLLSTTQDAVRPSTAVVWLRSGGEGQA